MAIRQICSGVILFYLVALVREGQIVLAKQSFPSRDALRNAVRQWVDGTWSGNDISTWDVSKVTDMR